MSHEDLEQFMLHKAKLWLDEGRILEQVVEVLKDLTSLAQEKF